MSTLDKKAWMRDSVAVPTLTREYEHIVKADDWTRENKKGVHVKVSELVHIHDVYRQLDKKGKALPTKWHRGARIAS